MEKEFKVYKEGRGLFELIESQVVSEHVIELKIKNDSLETFSKEDAVWGVLDMRTGKNENILVVNEADVDNVTTLKVRDADRGTIEHVREFEPGELFTIVATFRNKE